MLSLWEAPYVERVYDGVARRYQEGRYLRNMLRLGNMTGRHAQSGGGYNREGYAESVYAPAAGDCAFDRKVPCNLPGRDKASELPTLLWRRLTSGLDVALTF
eukprot:579086-Pleurochrysis_carterae.AAC.4